MSFLHAAMNPVKLPRVFFVVLLGSAGLRAADWPHWRGPAYDGISQETIPNDLPETLPVLWKTNVGIGFATVSVQDCRILTVGNRDGQDTIYCLNAENGALLWQHRYRCALDPNLYEGGPSATPTLHEGSVYTLSKKGHAFRLDLATGKVSWSRDLVADHGLTLPEWSFASSPFIVGDQVLLNVGRGGLALAKETGATRWMPSTETSGYATVVPFPGDPSGATHLLFSAKSLLGFDAATGKQHWEFPSRTSRDVNAADPIVRGNRVLFSNSLGAKLLEIAKDGTPQVVWEQRNLKWYFNAGVLIGDHLYSLHGTTHRPTELVCTRFATGETVWTEKGYGSGAMMAARDTILLLDLGQLTLFDASPSGFRPRVRQKILEGKCWTVPVLANGRIYCRNAEGDLVCIRVR